MGLDFNHLHLASEPMCTVTGPRPCAELLKSFHVLRCAAWGHLRAPPPAPARPSWLEYCSTSLNIGVLMGREPAVTAVSGLLITTLVHANTRDSSHVHDTRAPGGHLGASSRRRSDQASRSERENDSKESETESWSSGRDGERLRIRNLPLYLTFRCGVAVL